VVCFADLDEFLCGVGIAGVAVGMVAFGEGVEGLLDLGVFGVGSDAEGFIVVGYGVIATEGRRGERSRGETGAAYEAGWRRRV
jgi:hypothetical protein